MNKVSFLIKHTHTLKEKANNESRSIGNFQLKRKTLSHSTLPSNLTQILLPHFKLNKTGEEKISLINLPGYRKEEHIVIKTKNQKKRKSNK